MKPRHLSTCISLAFVTLLAPGCETAYEEHKRAGGYTDERVAADVFRVSFRGNARTSSDRVKDLAMLRAADLTLDHGFRYFKVLDRINRELPVSYKLPGAAHSDANVIGLDGTTYRSASALYGPSEEVHGFEPESELLIRCVASNPKSKSGSDALLVSKSIREKYRMPARTP